MAFVPAIMAVAAAAVGAYATHKQGQAAKQQANYQAGVTRSNAMQTQFDARTNVQTSEVQAAAAGLEGAQKSRDARSNVRRLKASSMAQLTRQGVTATSISIGDYLKSEETKAGASILNPLHQAANAGRGFRMQGEGFLNAGSRALSLGATDSAMMVLAGKNTARTADIGAFGQVLGGMAKGYSMYKGMG